MDGCLALLHLFMLDRVEAKAYADAEACHHEDHVVFGHSLHLLWTCMCENVHMSELVTEYACVEPSCARVYARAHVRTRLHVYGWTRTHV